MIDIRKLKELVRLMVANELTELDLRDADEQVTLRRPGPVQPPQVYHAPMQAQPMYAPPAQPSAPTSGNASAPASSGGGEKAADDTAGLHKIESPMVGTYYASPNPDSPPFIKVGDQVTPDTVICLIEAMKIFNEIKAECSGRVEKILVKNRDAVEFGQPLFLIKPD